MGPQELSEFFNGFVTRDEFNRAMGDIESDRLTPEDIEEEVEDQMMPVVQAVASTQEEVEEERGLRERLGERLASLVGIVEAIKEIKETSEAEGDDETTLRDKVFWGVVQLGGAYVGLPVGLLGLGVGIGTWVLGWRRGEDKPEDKIPEIIKQALGDKLEPVVEAAKTLRSVADILRDRTKES